MSPLSRLEIHGPRFYSELHSGSHSGSLRRPPVGRINQSRQRPGPSGMGQVGETVVRQTARAPTTAAAPLWPQGWISPWVFGFNANSLVRSDL